MRSNFLAILLFGFWIQLAAAERYAIHRRDVTTTSATSEASASPTTQGTRSSDTADASTTQSASKTTAVMSTSTSAALASTSTSSAASPTTATPSVSNSTIFNSTIPSGQLPITPEVTPAFAVAGIIFLITGIGYTLIGVRNKLLHVSLSAAYLASLSVTVLVIYVMSPPISNAVQGAYLVAAVMTGLVLGGGACLCAEITEGLGSLLGGFCFSMWLLVLKPGGLLTTTSGKSVFIAVLTVAAFATSFTHYTRPYGLVMGTAFAGSTAVVLGIDCFSRAGLKEFWVYIWNLNDNLFPLGATTYPITRGIRVEIAVIVIIFLVGILSQMKLWKLVQERREKQAAEQLQEESDIGEEEQSIGRRIEHQNAGDRGQWETVCGDRGQSNATLGERDSGIGSMEKKGTASTITSIGHSAKVEIEMEPMLSPRVGPETGLVTANNKQHTSVTVLVARDPEPQPELDEAGNPIVPPQKGLSQISVQADVERPITTVPAVVPLPFKVSGSVRDGECSSRSSIATFADDDQKPLTERLSTDTDNSKRSSRSLKRNSRRLSKASIASSTEALVVPHAIDDDRSSIAATVDELSDNEDTRSQRTSMQGSVLDTVEPEIPDSSAEVQTPPKEQTHASPAILSRSHSVATTTVTVATDILNPDLLEEEAPPVPETPLAPTSTDTEPKRPVNDQIAEEADPVQVQEAKGGPVSVNSTEEMKPASLSKDRLPPQLSKVVMSYRTNEWAKHLGNADAPALEELQLAHYPAEYPTKENVAPVNVQELQQTAETGRPAPAPRSMSQNSRASLRSKKLSTPSPFVAAASRRGYQQSTYFQQPVNTRPMYRSSSTPHIDNTIVESPIEAYFPPTPTASLPGVLPPMQSTPFGNATTLTGKRNSRNKTAYGNLTPEAHSQKSSESGSIHSNFGPIEDDNMSLRARRNLLRQSSLQASFEAQRMQRESLIQQIPTAFNSHQPKRQSSSQQPMVREQQMATWRASVQQDLQSSTQPKKQIERKQSQLWTERQAQEQVKAIAERKKRERDSMFDERMRSRNMLDAHREALSKMQRIANNAL